MGKFGDTEKQDGGEGYLRWGVERRPKAWLALQEPWSQEHPGISVPGREDIESLIGSLAVSSDMLGTVVYRVWFMLSSGRTLNDLLETRCSEHRLISGQSSMRYFPRPVNTALLKCACAH